mmetsp:Transcript_29237/g.58915  ORF Transcript_29237/g.58915 Transcript_29237/m.58915 type:complete len:268 (-) Transcript_29237:240-1043(-)
MADTEFQAEAADLRSMLDKHSRELNDRQKGFCTECTLRRYLRARNGKVEKAFNLLMGTLKWREEFGVHAITGSMVQSNGAKGKTHVAGCDTEGRPVLYMRPALEHAKNDHDGNLKHLVYQLELACSAMDEGNGIGKMLVLLDCKDYSAFNSPPMKTSRATLTILQDHYPERLGKFVIVDAPWYFHAFYNAIYPFIDKVTASKVTFITGKDEEKRAQLNAFIPLSQLPKGIYGEMEESAFFNGSTYFTLEGENKTRTDIQTQRRQRFK